MHKFAGMSSFAWLVCRYIPLFSRIVMDTQRVSGTSGVFFFVGVREFSAPSSYCLCLSPLSPWLLTPTLLLTPGIQHEKAIESDSATYGYLEPSTVHLEMVRLANILLKAKPDGEMLHILDIGSGISQASAR